VVRVSVKSEEREKETNEDIQWESKQHPELNTESKVHDKTEISLEKMTKAELLKKIKEVQESAEKNYDLYVRSLAETDNLKKRSQKEKEEWIKFANESLIKQLLPVVDNLEKALAHSNDENALHGLREGVELTRKGLMDTLKKAGLEEVQAAGEPFDPNFHEAVSAQVDDTTEPATILQELQKGYLLNQRLIRPAMVIISKSGE
jgi:molecular chaperone GrpE